MQFEAGWALPHLRLSHAAGFSRKSDLARALQKTKHEDDKALAEPEIGSAAGYRPHDDLTIADHLRAWRKFAPGEEEEVYGDGTCPPGLVLRDKVEFPKQLGALHAGNYRNNTVMTGKKTSLSSRSPVDPGDPHCPCLS